MEAQADRLCGLDETSQISQVRKQFLVDKFLQHSAEVLQMCYKCFQRFGPDSVFFRVTGSPDPVAFNKGNPDENYDIMISYDVLNSDPETQEKKLNQRKKWTDLSYHEGDGPRKRSDCKFASVKRSLGGPPDGR